MLETQNVINKFNNNNIFLYFFFKTRVNNDECFQQRYLSLDTALDNIYIN